MAPNLLVPIDLSDATDAVLDCARRLARGMGAKVWLLHVVPPGPSPAVFMGGTAFLGEPEDRDLTAELRQLQVLENTLRRNGVAAEFLVARGIAHTCILEQARQQQADWIVLGSHGHGALHHLLMGSVCEGVMKHANCPVTIVPTRATARQATTTPSEQAHA